MMRTKARSVAARAVRMTTLLFGVVLLLGAVSPVSADTIGYAVDSTGASLVGTQSGGTVSFYIPLTKEASGTYGSGGKGTSADTCSTPACVGGTLDMYLRFSPVQVGASVLTLTFSDLDLIGVNDPTYFLEKVVITPGDGVPIIQASDSRVLSANSGTQVLMLPMAVTSSPSFIVKLTFTSSFANPPGGTYINTVETVRATIRPVPEPLTLATLGLGLLALGIVSRRKKSQI